ncbi:hypothetical protein C8Q77DRAFT_1099940 [Trametes polyzona]|nr:hypothetical protein C8Q77DRAFT_1099940 [Trametes polyzona]
MSFTFAPNFVITKRRKRPRQAIDPCLGFYPTTLHTSTPIIPSTHAAGSEEAPPSPHKVLPPVIAGVCAQSPNPVDRPKGPGQPKAGNSITQSRSNAASPEKEQEALTVEEFLRRAASPTKRYTHQRSRKRKRAGRKEHSSQESYRPSSEPRSLSPSEEAHCSPGTRKRRQDAVAWTSDEAEDMHAVRKLAKKKRRPPTRKTRSFATRLLLAGVSTGVEVVGGPLLPTSEAHTPTYRPIPLVPHHRLPSPPTDSRFSRRHYVDPRKDTHLGRSSFQFGAGEDHGTSAHGPKASRPVTAWRPAVNAASIDYVGENQKSTSHDFERLITVPLVFASTNGSNHTSVPRHPTGQARSSSPVSSRQLPTSSAIPFTSFVLPSPKRPVPPSGIRLRPYTAGLAAISSPVRPQASSTGDSLTSPPISSPLPMSAPLLATSIVKHPTGLSVSCSPSTQDAVPLRSPLPLLDDRPGALASPAEHASHDDDILKYPTAVEALPNLSSALLKPMKSLGSLLDGFREIARSATQVSSGPQHTRSRLPRPQASTATATNSRATDFPAESGVSVATVASRRGSQYRRSSALSPKPSLALRRLQDRVRLSESPFGGEERSHSSGLAASPREDAVDILSVLRSRARDVLHLPSSPLPGWSALSGGADEAHSDGGNRSVRM